MFGVCPGPIMGAHRLHCLARVMRCSADAARTDRRKWPPAPIAQRRRESKFHCAHVTLAAQVWESNDSL